MFKRIVYTILLILLVCSCGTHRKSISTHEGEKQTTKPWTPSQPKDVEYKGTPWVTNTSKPYKISQGLQNKHLSVWASHGKYYNQAKARWDWQRPNLFCTNEDLYTQTIVVPYLIPMLENAGAIVFTPRERDWQKNEVIVDNDDKVLLPYYTELEFGQKWKSAGIKGFAYGNGFYCDINPFEEGSTRMAKASQTKECEISYQPKIPQSGEYAVYVSYPTHEKSIPDAQYTVFHKGRKTTFSVNQQIGGGTWVYLGTFDFAAGCTSENRVVLSNASSYKGVVTADAVRFGGGMGVIARGGGTSGLPKCLEGARYYAQFAGTPDSVYKAKDGTDDYKEDIYARPYMTNWLAGGSCFAPYYGGKGVPIELSLAVHSDAGTASDYSSIIGSLSICTTNTKGGMLASGLSRSKSKRFAELLLENITKDMTQKYGRWTRRDLYDRNYAETRCPAMTSAIIETLSHQNFPDMKMGQDPNFRFTLARSIYKSILRYMEAEHGRKYTVSPLSPINIRAEFIPKTDTLLIKWDAQADATEPTAKPKAYIIYTATENSGYDNGTMVYGNACKVKLQTGILYNFKVTAINEGGESFPTETMSALHHSVTAKTVLIANGFQRLASPHVIEGDFNQGFDLQEEAGVCQDKTLGLCGYQQVFDKSKIGIEGPGGLGYSGNELEGSIIKGNDFSYVETHAKAIRASKKYNIASCTRSAIENGLVNLGKYDCVDLILGLEKDDGYSLCKYKTFTPSLMKALSKYDGSLVVSGAYIGSDMAKLDEMRFLNDRLHLTFNGSTKPQTGNNIIGMGTSFDIYSMLNEEHYAATSIDKISPISPAFCALTDDQGNSVCVAYDGKADRTFVMGFPFECIKSEKKRAAVMTGILNFLLK